MFYMNRIGIGRGNSAKFILELICIFVFLIQWIILFAWVIVLFKLIFQLKRKVKYLTVFEYGRNEDARLELLNTKIEYIKFIFLFFIALFELISIILSAAASSEDLLNIIISNSGALEGKTINISSNNYNVALSESTSCNVTSHGWHIFNHSASRIIFVSFEISGICLMSSVYILLSYFGMVIKNSLNHNYSLKSADLAREQKKLILFSFVICLIFLILILRAEMILVFELFQNCVVLIQLALTSTIQEGLFVFSNGRYLTLN